MKSKVRQKFWSYALITSTFLMVLLMSTLSYGQILNFRAGTPPVFLEANGDTMKLATAGGVNAPQFNQMDVNNDGITDILIFDRTDSRYVVLISDGKGNYTHAPDYESLFPEASGWVVTKDYTNDGKFDLWFRNSRTQSTSVYKNVTQSWDRYVKLEKVSEQLTAYNFNTDTFFWEDTFFVLDHVDLYCGKASIPAIEDVDGDGDIDFLTLQESGQGVTLFLNVCKELKQPLDSPIFEEVDLCWGDFVESVDTANSITLQRYKWCSRKYYRYLKKHSGGSVLYLYDHDNDGDMDLILGNAGFENVLFLKNGKNDLGKELDTMISWTAAYPDPLHPGEVNIFPGVFMLDVTGDNIKDLLIAPNTTDKLSYLYIDETDNVRLFENTGTNALPVFKFKQNDAFVGEMLDHGSINTPILWDYDGDGDKDLILSSTGGHSATQDMADRLFLYENIGSASKPVFKLVDEDFLQMSGSKLRWTVPTIADINNGGNPELIIGDNTGYLHLYQLQKNNGTWEKVLLSDQAFGIKSPSISAPFFTDVDKDGKIDLLLGMYDGNTRYYRNISSTNVPDFQLVADTFGGVLSGGYAWRTFEKPDGSFIDTFMQIDDGIAFPVLMDLDGDGKREFVVGGAHGNVYIYDNVENNYTGTFDKSDIGFYNEVTREFEELPDFGSYARPVFADLNGDTVIDVLVGINRGGVMFRAGSMILSAGEYKKVSLPQVQVYPNPTDGSVTISLDGQKIDHVVIMDIKGVIIETVNGPSGPVDLSDLPQGLYFLEIHSGGTTASARVVKN